MKFRGSDLWYENYNKNLLITRGITEVFELPFIIKACRLKPAKWVMTGKSRRSVIQRWWMDEFGNSLKIDRKKNTIKFIMNDFELDKTKIINTDIFFGLSIEKIAKISNLAHLACVFDSELKYSMMMLTFLGLDDYLRNYLFTKDKWEIISPLYLGLENLMKLSENRFDTQIKKTAGSKILTPDAWKSWIIPVPCEKDFVTKIEQEYQVNLDIIKEK